MAWYPAFAQESVSVLSSCISSKLDDVASRRIMVARLEMAVLKLELAVERSGKLSVTDVSLLRQRKVIKGVWIEGKELLRMHKQLEGREEAGQVVTSSSFLGRVLSRATSNSILSLLGLDKGCLSSSDVKKFEQFAELADTFLKDVESGFSLRNSMICNPLLRLLFEWKTLGCVKKNGTSVSAFIAWTTHFADRGVKASLVYWHSNPRMPEKFCLLKLGLRISESTDIIGIVTRCFQPLVSQFKGAAEFAIGELSQLATATSNLREFPPPPRGHWLVRHMQHCAAMNRSSRLDPICCLSNGHGPSGDNTVSSSEFFPEEICFMHFGFHILLKKDKRYRLRNVASTSMGVMSFPLIVDIILVPHFEGGRFIPQFLKCKKSISVETGNKEYRITSIQEWLDTVGPTAMQSYLHRPKLKCYQMFLYSKHGVAFFLVTKPTSRRGTKRKR